MKFAFQTVLFLSSSFAFVKGEVCYEWPLSNCPDTTTRIALGGGYNLNEGTIPTEIGELTSLTHLEISDQEELTGSIPSEIGLLNALTHLVLGTFWGLLARLWFPYHFPYHSRLV